MTVCPSCGFRNEDSDTFCRNPACGAFQGWGDERVRTEQPSASAVDGSTGAGPDELDGVVNEDTQPFDAASEARRADPSDATWATAAQPAAAATPEPPAAAPEPPAAADPEPAAADAQPATGVWSPGARGEHETTADPFATGPFASDPAWRSARQELDATRMDAPGRPDSPSGDWDAATPSQSNPPESTPRPNHAAGQGGVGRDPERRVLSAAEAAWGTSDFLQQRPHTAARDEAASQDMQPQELPPYGAPPPRSGPYAPMPPGAGPPGAGPYEPGPPGVGPPGASQWRFPSPPVPPVEGAPPSTGEGSLDAQGRAYGSAWPPAAEPRSNPFPSQEQLLKQPPLWERLLRRTPIPVPGEGALRRAPSARERERQRAMLRFGALVLVVFLVGGALWLASSRDKPAKVAAGGESPGTSASPALAIARPTRVLASSQSGSRVASNVLDGKPDTFWSRLAPSDDDQPFLRFFFDRRVRLARITIASGASGSEFSHRPRPREIELRFSHDSTIRTRLADRRGFQTVSFSPRRVDVVRLVILSTYPSAGPQRTSISEIRFYMAKG